MKRWLALLLALAMCFMLAACGKSTGKKKPSDKDKEETSESAGDTTEDATDSKKPGKEDSADATDSKKPTTDNTDKPQTYPEGPILYKVTDNNGNVTWLFGSIHVGRDAYYPLPDYVINAFDNADSLAVEVDILKFEKDQSAQVQVLLQLLYRDGTTIKDHIPTELYNKAADILDQYGVSAASLTLYCPAFWASTIESLLIQEFDCDVNLGIDRHLINRAYDAKKEIVDIESAMSQYQMMANYDDEVQCLLLENAVAQYENKAQAEEDLMGLMDLWVSGDEDAFNAYLNTVDPAISAEERAAYERYNKAMITDRNINMADFAEDALASGEEVFICVGAAHVIGDGGMADLLTQRGYTVERVYETKTTKKLTTDKTNENNAEIIAYVDPSLTTAEARSIGTKINQIDSVYMARFVAAEQAFEDFTEDHGDNEAFGGADASLLRARYYITVEADAADSVKEQLAELAGIAEVK